jgi:hypothetical protein
MFDILKNHRVERLRSVSDQTQGAAVLPGSTYFDMWGNTQLPNRALFIIDVTDVNTTGTLILVFQDCETAAGTYDADFCTVATISAAGLYLVDLVDFKRYLRCSSTVANATVNWGGYMVTFEDQRRPVTQSGTTCSLTYGSGRSGKVATT